MSTHQEKSFIATLTTSSGALLVPRLAYGRQTHIQKPDYEAFTFEAKKDISNYLCVKSNAASTPLKFYFKCIDDYYSIYVMNEGLYYFYALSNEDEDLIALYPHDNDQTTFNLLDANSRIITLDDLNSNSSQVRIQTRGGRKLHARAGQRATAGDREKVSGLVCTGKKRGTLLNFRLDILQRNVSF